jgi:RNA polymerase sigma-70 factor (ECF subfamily)
LASRTCPSIAARDQAFLERNAEDFSLKQEQWWKEKAAVMSPDEKQQHQSFLRAFTAHEPAIRAFVRRLVPTRADADDVMQEAAIVLWEKFGGFREGADFRGWAFGVARFKVLAWLRDKGRDRLVLDDDVVDLLAAESANDEPRLDRQRRALETCADKLAPDQRALLMQAYQPEVRVQDVAAASGRTVAGFYQWLHRIRRTLLDCVRRELAKEASS